MMIRVNGRLFTGGFRYFVGFGVNKLLEICLNAKNFFDIEKIC